ncbi:MAG TPA: ABC transporter ATP-binding protein, partial [Candidatus Micrarchaeota archaeon]|nr:ABC transporter ATP-binding protein [Candidatus Micrarchaeota archaeon]
FVSIVGPSGSGKSTLLNLLGCLDKPTSGSIQIGGVDVSKLDSDDLATIRRDKIGFVFQAFNLASNLSVSKNVELPLIIAEQDSQKRAEIVGNLLSRVGLPHKANNMPSELSGGEKQRVAIARSLANNPCILLADEPTGNLDSKSGGEIMALFWELWKQGITIILITHEPQVAAYSGRVLTIRDGSIESDVVQKPQKVEGEALKVKKMPALAGHERKQPARRPHQ